jgi:trigger factor
MGGASKNILSPADQTAAHVGGVSFAKSTQLRTLAGTMSHEHNLDWKTAFTVEELPDSQVKITGELPYAELESERKAAIQALGKDIELDGFRKGNVPLPILEKHLGEMAILAEMAERAIAHAYPHIIDAHEIEAIGHPQIEVTKIAPKNPLAFNATVAIIPKFTLPDYVAIAREANAGRPSDEVSEAELEAKIVEIQKQKLAYERMQQKAAEAAEPEIKREEKEPETPNTPVLKAEEEKEPEPEIPELTDDYVKTLGQPGQFETVDDFKAKLREHLEIEKKRENATKHRSTITDEIIGQTDIKLPKILIDSELNQMWAQMEEDIKRADLKMDDYLAHIKKTREELNAEWTPAAEKRARLQLILNEIAKMEEIVPDKDAVEAQTAELMERFKDADIHRVRLYVASVLLNDEVMKFLEAK